ncbi:O-antigen/teichoic acid export membrane protein [Mucilaginibacter yixingensis]|uniref:O-antigen/teichoic acid export membrane protein n=1 Tax=Mucilaginibacter yixingensis TaxID=1295612 RepID=A0A2T5J7K8_9SPHI|nr:oligosaccharide flippase family protein [Mucilaginibacter yixingensis]PTQ95132.1 O-antigen/teichoic acid export membrane protein [Mucilaginibacter yixingensis]
MKAKLIHNFSFNAVQLVLNQLFGLLIFYALSTHLDKNTFGQINLVLAILMVAPYILSMGIDQLLIKKTAAGEDVSLNLSLYCFHVVLTGGLFYLILFIGWLIAPSLLTVYPILLLIGIGKMGMYFSTPFKQVANGLERFKLLAGVSVVSNALRGCALILLMWVHRLDLQTVVIIFIAGDLAEMICTIALFKLRVGVRFLSRWHFRQYLQLLKTALPQAGVVIITSALSRFDWIFIGLYLSSVKLAEYSFAYKLYELSTLPLLAIAPLLIPKFTQLFKNNSYNTSKLANLARIEMGIATLTILLLNVCWSPMVDWVTAGKYGAVNRNTIFLLSLSVPVIYLNNFLWTMYFAQGRLKMIFHSFLIALIINIGLDLLLIPIYKNEGAAVSVLVSLSAQCVFYISKNHIVQLRAAFVSWLVCTASAAGCILTINHFISNAFLAPGAAIILFMLMLAVSRQARRGDVATLKEILK